MHTTRTPTTSSSTHAGCLRRCRARDRVIFCNVWPTLQNPLERRWKLRETQRKSNRKPEISAYAEVNLQVVSVATCTGACADSKVNTLQVGAKQAASCGPSGRSQEPGSPPP